MSREGYKQVLDGGSPQLRTTLAQGAAIEAALSTRGVSAKSYIGMRYWHAPPCRGEEGRRGRVG